MPEEQGGNTPPQNQEGPNNPEEQEEPKQDNPESNPPFPPEAGDVSPQEEEEEPQTDPRIKEIQNDPNFKKFRDESGSVEMAYKRWQDSSTEAKRLSTEKEDLQQYQQEYEAVKRDFDIMRQKNPQLYQQVVDLFQNLEQGNDAPQGNQPQQDNQPNESMSEEKMQKIAELQTTLSEFKNDYKEVLGDEDDLKQVRSFAANLAGTKDKEGKPFTYRNALLAGLQYYHPEVVTDQAKMEAMADIEQRSSASEPGNSPSGSSPKGSDTPLTQAEKKVAQQFGMSDSEYRKYQQQ